MKRTAIALALALLGLAGCAGSTPSSPPLGRSFAAPPVRASAAPTPAGDPFPERDGIVPVLQGAEENAPSSGSLASSPQAALERYALVYTNWRASTLGRHELQLAALAVGPARLAAEQTAASASAATALTADHVRNTGVVLGIAPGQGPARGRWIVVTEERTTGTGPYAGLPPLTHVTVARVQQQGQRWVVSEWAPKS